MSGPVAVTGATGFIGTAILAALADSGWPVNALTRTPRGASPGIRWIRGHLGDAGSLAELTNACDTVIHCAGRVRGATASEFDAANVDGTANLLSAIGRRRTPPRLLLMSSLAAREPQLSWYAASKHRAEQVLAGHAEFIHGTIFRPTAVYGPGDREMRPMLDSLRRGFLPLAGGAHRHFGLLHVHDLVAAVLRWLAAPVTSSGPYELDDGTPGGYDSVALKATAESALGQRVRIIPLPSPLLYCAAGLNLAFSRVWGRSPMLTPGKVRELTHADWVCDNGPAAAALGWKPRIRLADALRDSARLIDG